jgi:hypothetical protein
LAKGRSARFQSAAAFKEVIERLDETTASKLDRMILTRAFEVKAAELPEEAMTAVPREGSVTQTMPNTPTPGKGRPLVAAPPSAGVTPPGFGVETNPSGSWRPHQIVALVFGMLIALVSLAGVFGPALIREWRNNGQATPNGATTESTQATSEANGQQTAATQTPPATASAVAAQPGGTSPAAPEAPAAPRPAPAGESIVAGQGGPSASASTPRTGATQQPFGPAGPGRPGGPPPDGRMPPEFESEFRETMREVEEDLKDAGIDMKLMGPESREGRRFAALERAQQFADIAKRYGNAIKRRQDLEKQREEMGRRPLQEANRRVRGRMLSEMSNHWRTVSESLGAAEGAIKSQNLTLAAEKLTIAEREMGAIESMMAAVRARTEPSSRP